jgi:hypothetical protein
VEHEEGLDAVGLGEHAQADATGQEVGVVGVAAVLADDRPGVARLRRAVVGKREADRMAVTLEADESVISRRLGEREPDGRPVGQRVDVGLDIAVEELAGLAEREVDRLPLAGALGLVEDGTAEDLRDEAAVGLLERARVGRPQLCALDAFGLFVSQHRRPGFIGRRWAVERAFRLRARLGLCARLGRWLVRRLQLDRR